MYVLSFSFCFDCRERSVGGRFWDLLAEGSWNPCFSRAFNDWEVEEAERFLERLNGKGVIEDVDDNMSWSETKSGKLSVKSLLCPRNGLSVFVSF